MLKVAICDDSSMYSEKIETFVTRFGAANLVEVKTEVFTSGSQLMLYFGEKKFDLIFLDISMPGLESLYMDSLCSHHAEIQYLYLIYTVYNVIILPFHSCKKKRAPFTALFHVDFLIHLSYSTVLQPMSLNFFPKMGQSLVLHQMPSQLLSLYILEDFGIKAGRCWK